MAGLGVQIMFVPMPYGGDSTEWVKNVVHSLEPGEKPSFKHRKK